MRFHSLQGVYIPDPYREQREALIQWGGKDRDGRRSLFLWVLIILFVTYRSSRHERLLFLSVRGGSMPSARGAAKGEDDPARP